MKRFLTLVASIYSFLLVILTIALVFTSSPVETPLSVIQRCRSRACLFGIIPGTTKFTDAKVILTNNPLIHIVHQNEDTVLAYIDYAEYDKISFEVGKDNTNHSAVINTFFGNISLNLADFIKKFGDPCSVNYDPGAGENSIAGINSANFHDASIFTSDFASRRSFAQDLPFTGVSGWSVLITNSDDGCKPDEYTFPWKGLASSDYYYRRYYQK